MSAIDLTFCSEVTDETINVLCDGVAQLIQAGETTVRVVLTSPGGDLFASFAAYDRLKLFQRENFFTLEMVATGYCLSAGNVLLQAGERRYATPHTVFMLHQPEQFPWTKERESIVPAEIMGRAALHTVSVNLLADILSRGQDVKGWRKKLNTLGQDYFEVEQALQLGLIDSVLPVEGWVPCPTKATCAS